MSDKKSDLGDVLAGLGAFAGFLVGGAAGANDAELGFWPGAITGVLMGAAGGKILGAVVSMVIQVLMLIIFIAVILFRLKALFDFMAS